MRALIFDTEFVWPAGFERTTKDGEPRVPHAPNAVVESIAYVSIAEVEDGHAIKLGTIDATTERDRVGRFVTTWGRTRPVMVTFNGRTSDVPLLLARCMHHRIVPGAWTFDVGFANRYRSPHHVDLYDVLGLYGANRSGGLDDWARCVGWPGKIGTSGGDVAALLQQPDGRRFVDAYCLGDAVQTAAVWLRFCLLTAEIAPELYAILAQKLLEAVLADERVSAIGAMVDRVAWLGGER